MPRFISVLWIATLLFLPAPSSGKIVIYDVVGEVEFADSLFETLFGVGAGAPISGRLSYDDSLVLEPEWFLFGAEFDMQIVIGNVTLHEELDVDYPEFPLLFFEGGMPVGIDYLVCGDPGFFAFSWAYTTCPNEDEDAEFIGNHWIFNNSVNSTIGIEDSTVSAVGNYAFVPEPSSLALSLLGLAAGGLAMRGRRAGRSGQPD
jgi:hypothetical protein